MGQRRQIEGARILITGASQGIGKALAEEAVRRGARVVAAPRSVELLRDMEASLQGAKGTFRWVQADVTSAEDRQRMVEACVEFYGGLDILVNNAGIGATGHFAEVAPERMRKIFEVNFFGLTETTRVCLPLLKRGNKPAIVNISSIAGKRALPARSEYSASKYAVQGFSEALRAELSKDNVDVLVICPGLTQTNFSQNMIEQKARMKLDHMRGMSSEEVARQTLRAIEKGKNETHLTWFGKLIVYISRFFPRFADRFAAKKVRQVFAQEAAKPRENQEPVGSSR